MNDALLVSRFERFSNLLRERQRLSDRDCATGDPLRELLAFDEFHHKREDALALLELVDTGNVRMVQAREQALPLRAENGDPIVNAGER